MPLGFRLIDTEYMNIRQENDPASFAALSYMWASSGSSNDIRLETGNVREFELPGGLITTSLPGIISDAISLCNDLGERYLWIDRLCIVQDDENLKRGQISAMDTIYRSAAFTIVAALNDRTGFGLPGYNNRPRAQYSSWFRPPLSPEVEARGVHPNGIEAIVNASSWNKRGWTFQERILSRVCLFITEYQAIFECSGGTVEEELTWTASNPVRLVEGSIQSISTPLQTIEEPEHAGVIAGTARYRLGIRPEEFLTTTLNLETYCCWIEKYSARQLSFGADIINAFSGVANVLNEAFGTAMVYGLPEKYMAQCLMWRCYGPLARRGEMAQIPSWSWASCLNVVDYHLGIRVDNIDLTNIASIVMFYIQDPDKGLRKLHTEDRWVEEVARIEDVATQTELPAMEARRPGLSGRYLKWMPGDWRTNEIWRGCPQNPWEVAARAALDPDALKIATIFPGALVFNTTVASLKMRMDIPHTEGAGIALYSHEGNRVGVINPTSREWIEARHDSEGNGRLFDYIVISGFLESLGMRKWQVIRRNHNESWYLNVIMVERLPCKPYVVRRIDVGKVWTYQWKDCNPRWETVVLC